jgi:hypothetical protein
MRNVTMRCVHVNIVAMEKQCVLNFMNVSLYSYLSYPARQSQSFMLRVILSSVACLSVCLSVPYFSTLSHKRNDFRGKKYEQEMCFNFLYKSVSNIFYCTKNSGRHDQKRVLLFMQTTRHSCQVLIKLEFSR